MLAFNIKLSREQQAELNDQLKASQAKGDLAEAKRILVLMSLVAGQCTRNIAEILQMSVETIRQTVHRYLIGGIDKMKSKYRPGRPSKLTKT